MLLAQLAALGQQDQLRGRLALRTDAVGQGDERLDRRRNLGERDHKVLLGVFDPLPDGHLFVRFEQPALADVLEVQPDEIDVLTADAFLAFRLLRRGLLVGRHVLVGKRFGLLLVQDLRGGLAERLSFFLALVDFQAEVVRPLAPVEHVRLTRRILPFDERLPPASGAERERLGGLLGHRYPREMQGCCPHPLLIRTSGRAKWPWYTSRWDRVAQW